MSNSRRYIVSLTTIIILVSVTFILIIRKNSNDVRRMESDYAVDTLRYKNVEVSCFQVLDGWGYDIHVNGNRYIHQPMIPALQGNKVFATETDARKVAEFVAEKIRKNVNPPSVSWEELDSLGIQKIK